jgi:DNA-binding PadR family transcriptional regulator
MSSADSRAKKAIKLTPFSHLVLGMVRLGVSSGYSIKKVADISTQNFWPTSLAQVYPELARLEGAGLLTRRSDPHGARQRSTYSITPQGEAALRAWLGSPRMAPVQIRDEAMLRLFFADALEGEDQPKLIAQLRERNRDEKEQMRREIIPHAEALESEGVRYPARAARFSADLFAYSEKWLARLEAKLVEADRPAGIDQPLD